MLARNRLALTILAALASAAVARAAMVSRSDAPLFSAVGNAPSVAPASKAVPVTLSVVGDRLLADVNWLLVVPQRSGATGLAVWAGSHWPMQLGLGALTADEAGAVSGVVTELPPGPSSLALVLSALASFGAYQGIRSLKRLHLGFVPDWYHAEATQVGHVTPLLIEFDWSALPACLFDLPSDLRSGISYVIPREHRSRFGSEPLVPTRCPRSPPLFS